MDSQTQTDAASPKCDYLEQYPALNCKAFHDGILVPNESDLHQHCLTHPETCSHHQQAKHPEQAHP